MNADLPRDALIAPVFADAADCPEVITLILATDDKFNKLARGAKYYGADGRKEPAILSHGLAVQLYAPSAEDALAIVRSAARSPSAVLSAARYPGYPVYHLDQIKAHGDTVEFFRKYGLRLGTQEWLKNNPGPNHIARDQATMLPSGWSVFDHDIHDHTPPKWDVDTRIWLDQLEEYLPGVSRAPRVAVPSNSARIANAAGEVLSPGRGTVWLLSKGASQSNKVRDDVRARIRSCLITAGAAWTAPTKTGQVAVHIPVDLSTLVPTQPTFAGKPTCEKASGLSVIDVQPEIANEDRLRLDLGNLPMVDNGALLNAMKLLRPGVQMTVSGSGNRCQADIFDMAPDLELDSANYGHLTFDECIDLIKTGVTDKVRIQSPIRPESRSWAAFIGVAKNGDGYLIDQGLPGETHWLQRETAVEAFSALPLAEPDAGHTVITAPSSSRPWHPLLCFMPPEERPKPPAWVIPGLIAEGLVVIAGAHGIGKTTALLPLALIAAGINRPDDPLKAKHWRHLVYVSEDPQQAWRILHGLRDHSDGRPEAHLIEERMHLVPAARLSVEQVVMVGEEYRNRFTRVVDGVEVPPLVVIDTKSAVIAIDDENANGEASKVIAALKQQFAGLSTWLIGHVAKASFGRTDVADLSIRGGSAIEADANQVLYLIDEGGTRFLVRGKTRFEAKWKELEIQSYTADVLAADAWGDVEPLTLRWGQPAPPTLSREDLKTQQRHEAKEASAERLQQHVLDLVRVAGPGQQLSRSAVVQLLGVRRDEGYAAIATLLSAGALREVDIPPAERTHNNRRTRLEVPP